MKKLLFVATFIAMWGFMAETSAQIRLDVEGNAIIRDNTPTLNLFDNVNGENRIEGVLGEFGNVIELSSLWGDLRFLTGISGIATDRMAIDGATGNVGIGTNNPSTRLHLVGGTDAEVGSGGYLVTGNITGDNVAIDENEIMARSNGVGSTLFLQKGSGDLDISQSDIYVDASVSRVGMGTNAPEQKLHVVGNVRVTGDVLLGSLEAFRDGGGLTIETNSDFVPETHLGSDLGRSIILGWDDVFADDFVNISDMREKHNVESMTYGLTQIQALNPISYILNQDPQNEVKLGLSAQELLTVVPEAVKTQDIQKDEDGNESIVDMDRYGVKYMSLIPVLINAIKELNTEVETLKQQVQDLQN